MRVDPGLSRSQLMERFGVGNGTLTDWLQGLDPPEWTRRPRARDDLREQAVALRHAGSTVPKIAATLGVSKSTAYQWTKHLPLDRSPAEKAERQRRHMADMREARWEPHRKARDAERVAVHQQLSSWVGELTDRELVLIGTVAYWCEGTREKPWHKSANSMEFINNDPHLILLFLRYVELLGLRRESLTYRLSIHESADIAAATGWWADLAGVSLERFRKASVKTHNPSTVRHHIGDSYRGCLIVRLPKSSRLYWEVEAVMEGIAASGDDWGAASM
ncbi:hypothetical protein Ari01nite_66390 [Paractinoplanes rishiriensis]|uniref:Homeodomain-like domain-containing protein n=1 Tax=Paractinoplanes rishiriensis TaxID=1050105 RepID=A0A919MXY1_9ACTN|nr:hypothetical protein Ari01nite_66390 [Actinoplanes rishiriensis]